MIILILLLYRPYVCDKCGAGYYRKNILKKHILDCKAEPGIQKQPEIQTPKLIEPQKHA